MANETKETAAKAGKEGKKSKEGKTERRRLVYLKARSKELKAEMLANRKESTELREKLGISGKKADKAKVSAEKE